ncbi:MAG: peptidylprolyl isomerase [Sphingobacteriales bacterium]|nr:peptidylprolyl isomerase [Sphingobacteriales bacterium]
MNRKSLFLLLALCGSMLSVTAQTLFTYGPYKADAKEFLRAYNKNNTNSGGNKARSVKEYLDLYIKSKLKVREAYERRYDTLASINTEVENLRAQIAESFMTDPEIIGRLQKEAFQRSQKNIRVAHIFIAFKNPAGLTDTLAAQNRRDEVLKRLQNGEDFLQLARQFSDDPAVKINGGEIGFITVFTLPYEFENAIYGTAVGKTTAPVRSKIGYHIFKNLGERKSPGKMKARQILLATPPGADETVKKQLAALADSLYRRLQAGDEFGPLAKTYSNDYISAANNGMMPDISVGQYDPVFEKALWGLTRDSAVSKPFQTSHGWHILQRVGVKPAITDANNKEYQQELQQKIMADSRWKASKDHIYKQVREKAGVKQLLNNDIALRAYSDSLLDHAPMQEAGKSLSPSSTVLSIGKETYDLSDWISYAGVFRFRPDGTGAKPFEQVKEEWVQHTMFEYYKKNLEDFNEEFRNQMAEFRDGNLFFEIMQQEVWTRAQSDTAALQALYEKNRKDYTWKLSADVVIFFCSDPSIAQTIYDKVKANPAGWKKIADTYSEKVLADSSRYEWSQIPNLNKMTPRAGMMTSPLVNESDNTASFAYIFNAYPQTLQRSFSEAKGLVINDYQVILEKQWEELLRKKYPVVIDQKVLGAVLK